VRLRVIFGVSLAVLVGASLMSSGKSALAPIGIGLAAWVFLGTMQDLAGRVRLFQGPLVDTLRRLAALPRASWGMTIAHSGVAVALAGMTVSSGWSAEGIQVMKPGDDVVVAGDTWHFDGTAPVKGSNWTGMQAQFSVSDGGGRPFTVLTPSRRTYSLQQMTLAKVAIHTNNVANWYVVVGDPQPQGGWIVRIYWHPLAPWIWYGVLIMAAGGAVSLSDRRLRIGAPVRRPVGVSGKHHAPA
jgi:cytochrome c-type biogenesis protein CcmF